MLSIVLLLGLDEIPWVTASKDHLQAAAKACMNKKETNHEGYTHSPKQSIRDSPTAAIDKGAGPALPGASVQSHSLPHMNGNHGDDFPPIHLQRMQNFRSNNVPFCVYI
jgi:hypothetical protein